MVWLVDISRLIENLHLQTPTGIDRVEMAYAQHFLKRAATDDVRFVATWPQFSGLLDAETIAPVIEDAARRWTGGQGARTDTSFETLQAVLQQPIDHSRKRPQRIGVPDERRSLADWQQIASLYLRSAARRLNGSLLENLKGKNGRYIHVSQFRLNRPQRFAWLSQTKLRSLFMLHDIIPITHPEYCRPGEAEKHRARVETMLRHADRIVTVSDATRQSLDGYLARKERTGPTTDVVPLGMTASFLSQNIKAVESAVPYFVVVGTIEPRKNLLHLLTVWHRFAQESGHMARLVIVGRRGWENENILELLDRSAGLAPSVIEVTSLGDYAMASLMKGAAALLAPSFVEGYGLPIAEALALGVPVVASDTPAHREAGGGFADYLDPLDGRAWIEAFNDYATPGSIRRRSIVDRLGGHRPVTWSDHLSKIETILA